MPEKGNTNHVNTILYSATVMVNESMF